MWQKFEIGGFNNDGISQLFVDNQQAENYNELQIIKLQTNNARKITNIAVVNSVRVHRFIKKQAKGLPNQLLVRVGSKVLLTKNLKQAANLVNRGTGIAKDIIYAENDTPANNLPIHIIVDFGDTYTGKSLFEDYPDIGGWISIKPTVADFFCVLYKWVCKT